MSNLIDFAVLRCPNDLAVTPLVPRRLLIIGSCLTNRWARRMKTLPEPCESDVYMVGLDLPDRPERPIEEYDFQLIQPALRFVLPDASFAKLGQLDHDGHQRLFDHALEVMRRHVGGAMRWNREHGILTFVSPFIVPLQNAVGRLMPRYDLRNPVYFVEKLNEAIAGELEHYQNAYLFDLNEIHSFHGRRFVQEECFTAFNHGGYMTDFDSGHDTNRLEPASKATDLHEDKADSMFPALWNELLAMYRSIPRIDMVKLVVIDLDDTLWRGVVADLELDALPSSEGWPKGFWEALALLKRRGILLAIISKNEESRVLALWDTILGHRLSLEDFAIHRINWQTKSHNMSEILAYLNLLPRNVVYIDDNPAERAEIKAAFSDIRVLGGTPLEWRRILMWSPETQVPDITTESTSRTAMVRAQVVREDQRKALSREEFLATLHVRMRQFTIEDVTHPRFPRALELINKTNQFNTTGHRWTREECVTAFAAGTAFCAFEVTDVYTEYGLVGVLVVDRGAIRQFVMSCRVMGLEAEIAAVAHVTDLLRASGAANIFAAMIDTERNQPCRNLYSRCGFVEAEGGWERATAPALRIPAHIQMTTDGGAMVAPPAVNPRSTDFGHKWMAPDHATMADVE